ncbi:MAG: hypothetical protein IIY04_04695, partial [Oscillospiraceae bacterium]|nr:hypothetical protein [Oscillospiraceae bacterium]
TEILSDLAERQVSGQASDLHFIRHTISPYSSKIAEFLCNIIKLMPKIVNSFRLWRLFVNNYLLLVIFSIFACKPPHSVLYS